MMNYEDFKKLLEHIEQISKESGYLCRHSDVEVYAKAAKINNLAHEINKFLNRRKPKK